MKYKMTTFTALTSIALATSSQATILYGLLSDNSLSRFNSATPNTTTSIAISGLGGDDLVGIDYRPANGRVYGISDNDNVYTIDLSTGAATQLGSSLSPALMGSSFGFDFNPAFMSGEFARIISDTDDNVVISGDTGAYLGQPKADVFYISGDANAGADPNINHIAYDNSVAGATMTQQFGIDTTLNVLTTVKNNDGDLETIGSLGINAGALGGFDIDGATGDAFALFDNGDNTSSLYSIDLTTGAATLLEGSFSGSAVGLTAVPEPSSTLLLGLGSLAMILRRRK